MDLSQFKSKPAVLIQTPTTAQEEKMTSDLNGSYRLSPAPFSDEGTSFFQMTSCTPPVNSKRD